MTQNTAIINEADNNQEVINRKIELATAGLHYFIHKHLTQNVLVTMAPVLMPFDVPMSIKFGPTNITNPVVFLSILSQLLET